MEEERSRKLADDLAHAEVDAFISSKEAKMYSDDFTYLHSQYKALEVQLRGNVLTASIPPPTVADVPMRETTPGSSDGANSWWDDIMGTSPRSEPPGLMEIKDSVDVESTLLRSKALKGATCMGCLRLL